MHGSDTRRLWAEPQFTRYVDDFRLLVIGLPRAFLLLEALPLSIVINTSKDDVKVRLVDVPGRRYSFCTIDGPGGGCEKHAEQAE